MRLRFASEKEQLEFLEQNFTSGDDHSVKARIPRSVDFRTITCLQEQLRRVEGGARKE